jgi:hypothetical protein
MEGRCYVMKDWFGISSAYLSGGVSTRGQRRLHHAANGGCLREEEGDDAPQNSCRTIKKLKGGIRFRAVRPRNLSGAKSSKC